MQHCSHSSCGVSLFDCCLRRCATLLSCICRSTTAFFRHLGEPPLIGCEIESLHWPAVSVRCESWSATDHKRLQASDDNWPNGPLGCLFKPPRDGFVPRNSCRTHEVHIFLCACSHLHLLLLLSRTCTSQSVQSCTSKTNLIKCRISSAIGQAVAAKCLCSKLYLAFHQIQWYKHKKRTIYIWTIIDL